MIKPTLFKRHFQIAYVVDEIRSAMQRFDQDYGIAHWDLLDMQALNDEASASLFIANAWVGDMMIELIQPNPAVSSFYSDWRTDSAPPFPLHHLGFLADSADDLLAARQRLEQAEYAIAQDGSFGDVLDYAYADTNASLGHYHEIIYLKSQGQAFFDRSPRN